MLDSIGILEWLIFLVHCEKCQKLATSWRDMHTLAMRFTRNFARITWNMEPNDQMDLVWSYYNKFIRLCKLKFSCDWSQLNPINVLFNRKTPSYRLENLKVLKCHACQKSLLQGRGEKKEQLYKKNIPKFLEAFSDIL